MTTETLPPSMSLPADAEQSEQDRTAEGMTSFADLGVHPRAVARLAEMGIETPTLIQARGIPPLLAGRDVVGQSRTGSGKTIAYGLPLVERMDPRLRRLQALVLVPTRELAGQVASVLLALGANRGLRVAQLIGGRSYLPQREALRLGAQIAVGAPGRVLDHLRQGTLDLSHLTFAVLDEADQMLDAGFAPDVERLLSAMPERRQLALFTATLPEMTTEIAQRYLHEPVSVDAGTPESRPAPTITQIAYTVPREHRLSALMTLLDRRREASGTTLVFGRTKHGVDKLARQLVARGYPVAALHGNMSQNARDRVLADFRSGRAPMLLATNVAARGLDVLSIEQVINYELPESAELFTHRVGRTGRMDNTGEAITLLTPDDMAAWRRFQRDLAMKVKPLPFPLGEIGELPANTLPAAPAASIEAQPSVAPAAIPAVDVTAHAQPERSADWGERRSRRPEGREGRPERPASRSSERGRERGFADRGDGRRRSYERAHEHGDYERGDARGFDADRERRPARRSFEDDARPSRREDVVNRWTRPVPAAERRDDYREDSRENSRETRESRYERDEARDGGYRERREPRREFRRDDRTGDRFSERSGDRAPRRDGRRSDERPAGRTSRANGPRRATNSFRSSEGGSARRSAGARSHRPSRG